MFKEMVVKTNICNSFIEGFLKIKMSLETNGIVTKSSLFPKILLKSNNVQKHQSRFLGICKSTDI
jgi:hypothetical protein